MCMCVHCSLLRHNLYTGMGTNHKWTAQWILYVPIYINIARIKTLNIHSTQKAPLCLLVSTCTNLWRRIAFWLLSTLITFAYSWVSNKWNQALCTADPWIAWFELWIHIHSGFFSGNINIFYSTAWPVVGWICGWNHDFGRSQTVKLYMDFQSCRGWHP